MAEEESVGLGAASVTQFGSAWTYRVPWNEQFREVDLEGDAMAGNGQGRG